MTADPSNGSAAAPVELFSTSILGNHKVRSRHERFISVLTIKKIPFVYHDLASDEDAKSRWRRKAKDPQIPGLLVHNEWRGTFEEFEESIEFGELDLFLSIDHDRTKREHEAGLAPSISTLSVPSNLETPSKTEPDDSQSTTSSERKPSKHIVKTVPGLAQPRQPSQGGRGPSLPMAAEGSGRRKEEDADKFFQSLGITDSSLTEDEIKEILEAGDSLDNLDAGGDSERGTGKYPESLGLGGRTRDAKPIARTYIPSADAGIKPLNLAKMPNATRAASAMEPGQRTIGSPHARYNASQLSSQSLAAEAKASIASRSFSSMRLREAVSRGDDLQSAISSVRTASNTDTAEQIVGREDIDDLMASLGLGDVKMSDEEAEAFLLEGTIPEGTLSGGSRLGRQGSLADRARVETAARSVAQRAKERGYGSGSSRRTSTASSDAASLSEPSTTQADQEVENAQGDEIVKGGVVNEEVGDQTTWIHPEEEEEGDDDDAGLSGPEDKIGDQTPRQNNIPLPSSSPPNSSKQEGEGRVVDSADNNPHSVSDAHQDSTTSPEQKSPIPLSPNCSEQNTNEPVSALRSLSPSQDSNGSLWQTPSIPTSPEQGREASRPLASSDMNITQAKPAEQKPLSPIKSPAKIPLPASLPTSPTDVGSHTHRGAHTPSSPYSAGAKQALPGTPPARRSSARKGHTGADSQGSLTAILDSAAIPTPPKPKNAKQRPPSALQLDQSFASLASQIDFGDGNEDASVNGNHRVSVQSQESRNSGRKSEGALSIRASSSSNRDAKHNSGSIASPPRTSVLSSPAESIASLSKSPPFSAKNSPTSSPVNRRRAIDVQRAPSAMSPSSSMGSPYSVTSPSARKGTPDLLTGAMNRSTSQMSDFSIGSSEMKSPKAGKKFFSLGRRREGKKGRPSVSEESDEEDSNAKEMTSSESGGSNMDRSQKTLSVILREADEALAGIDDVDSGSDHSLEDDGIGAFDLEIDPQQS